MVRLQKFIADAGITSRRKAEDLIVQGRIKINGICTTQLGVKVNPEHDVVMLDGEPIDSRQVQKIYIILNKPRGYMTTLKDPEGRKTVMDLLYDCTERIYPIGRLDYLSEGLLLMTNDGLLANQIIHPSSQITKVYEVKIFGTVHEKILHALRAGVSTPHGFLKPKSVRLIKRLPGKTWLEFRLEEGRNREIRKICEACGLTIDKLKRVAIGGLSIEGIKPGSYRYLTKKKLLQEIGFDKESLIFRSREYRSQKKTIKIKSIKPQFKKLEDAPCADSKSFWKFRKEHYFRTLLNRQQS